MIAIFGLMVFSVGLSTPGVAGMRHALTHNAAPVAVGQHHHHGADGSVETHGHNDPSPEGKSGPTDKVGHAHGFTGSGDLAAVPLDPTFADALVGQQGVMPADARELSARSPHLIQRPPRTA